ncbi:MAG: hypothetical protein L6V93_05010 [Clostridiales bacterium]|nr:MAG: hypothetical protein L6V93_05010 [Clostridiales bacterium]
MRTKRFPYVFFGLDKLPSDAENALPGAVIYAKSVYARKKDLTFSVPVDMNGYETGGIQTFGLSGERKSI